MRKFFIYFGFISTMIFLELLYINFQLDEKISKIERNQEQYNFAIESINQVSDQTINGIDQVQSRKLISIE